MLLYFVRHGIAIGREDPGCPPEAERYLTKKGIDKTRGVAAGLRALGVEADAMFSSPLVRAVQTAEIVAGALSFPREKIHRTEALLPNARPSGIFRELGKVRAKSIMCVGHAPHLDEAIALAVGSASPVTQLKKAGVACLELRSVANPDGKLLWVYTPKALRRLAK